MVAVEKILLLFKIKSLTLDLEIIYNNPVKEEIVYLAEEYKYSSAVDYTEGKGILDVEVIK